MKIERKNIPEAFVLFVINAIEKDKGIRAAFRNADNPATGDQVWEYLARFNISLHNPKEYLPYTTIGAAIAKGKIKMNGSKKIGQVLAACYEESSNSEQAKARFRRLVACESVEEVCQILKRLLNLIRSNSKLANDLNFTQLLKDLLNFRWDEARQKVKSRWAQDFFYVESEKEEVV